MSRDARYQKLLNSKRWKELRVQCLQAKPLCERCAADGYVRAAVDCHHIVPVETGRTLQEMERLAYDPDNIQCLCVPCHIAAHKEMHKGTKGNQQERTTQRLARFMDSVRGMGTHTSPGEVILVQPPSDSEISLPSSVLKDELSKSGFSEGYDRSK